LTSAPPEHVELLANLKSQKERLVALRDRCRGDVDSFVMYRYLHRSWKVYQAQGTINEMLALFLAVAPQGVPVDAIYSESIKDALARKWSESTNENWEAEVGPVVSTYWLMRYFVDECVRCTDLHETPAMLPEGWAALLEIYGIRDL
jgi:hypothetical protein